MKIPNGKNAIDFIIDYIEEMNDENLNMKSLYMKASIIADKYKRLISERIQKGPAFTDQEYKRLKTACESITVIFKQVLGIGGVDAMNKTETEEKVKNVQPKVMLGLPLTTFERALWILYGNLDNSR